MSEEVLLICGDQLFSRQRLGSLADLPVLMVESHDLCRHVPYHQHKLVFHLAAMRHYAAERREQGTTVVYRSLQQSDPQASHWQQVIDQMQQHGWRCLRCFPLADRFAREAMHQACQEASIAVREEADSPLFATPLASLDAWVSDARRLHLADFWQWQRRRTGLLMDGHGEPVGGRWSFDRDNRQALPPTLSVPTYQPPAPGSVEQAVIKEVQQSFPDHLGHGQAFAWATTRAQAQHMWRQFLTQRLPHFGAYQDAMSVEHDMLFHSCVSPYINVGLLHPSDLAGDVVEAYEQGHAPLAAVEGWCRQVLGWREFVYGIDRHYGTHQDHANHYHAQRRLAPCWWRGGSTIPPLDHLIDKIHRRAYGHHIERLMVAGNLMTLCQVHPREAWKWFMQCFIDSADWVMGPNVMGMALHADGGLMTTKPYVCGANYLKKMGRWPKGPWQDGITGLYWAFIDRHAKELLANHRMARAVRTWQNMGQQARHQRLDQAAAWQDRLTLA
ncbi:MAG: hypothetical protein EA401_10875 [Planctomycetota bacterium]|nr:MAG: hypothetical protein EA401_10875 [Planctomycetota bacterium]